jgi:hypothetical protein
MKTEFGRGYATCLLMFAFHEPRIDEYVELNEQMLRKHPDDPHLWTEDDACETWANGASDHLYDLIRPRRGITKAEWQRAKALRDIAIAVGHGFRFTPRPDVTGAEMHALCDEARDLVRSAAERAGIAYGTYDKAWALDVGLGLRPVRGESANCEEPIRRRAS